MQSLWNDNEATAFGSDLLGLRVYTSRLLGRDANLVLHGGGNTSVKATVENIFGEKEEIIYVKGSGGDLISIDRNGFAPIRLNVLKRMAEFPHLTDTEMVRLQRAAMIDPYAPNPSVEAILHAIIPFQFVDHTHADAVVTITNTPDGEEKIREVYGDRILIVPYVMPGFILAKKVYEMTRGFDWSRCEGIILLNHGIFTFDNDARKSYERMIQLVSEAERYLGKKGDRVSLSERSQTVDLLKLSSIRRAVSQVRGQAMLAQLKTDSQSIHFASLPNVSSLATRGPLTPDHVIRTKRIAAIFKDDPTEDLQCFTTDYQKYFGRHQSGQKQLDPAPRWAVWQGQGVLAFGQTPQDLQIVSDIVDHTIIAIQNAESLGGWRALSEKDIFDVEYWELEQAKLAKAGTPLPFAGKVALVTGAASGIGRACVEVLQEQGAVVCAVDMNPEVSKIFKGPSVIGQVCDVTQEEALIHAIENTIRQFGGLDILISNAGAFFASDSLADLSPATWGKSLAINLTSHQRLLKMAIPYLKLGMDPAVVIVGSKNVPAPGPGAGAYSVAKAGLTQMARVAALELASDGIRVNVVHPNQVFDTAIWTPEVLAERAKRYQMTVEEYRKSNLLKIEITSKDVANLVCAMAGPVFAKTTGAQIPIDGGNERVI